MAKMAKITAIHKSNSRRVARTWWYGDNAKWQAAGNCKRDEIVYPVQIAGIGIESVKTGWAVGK